jgi:hypothetical protein
VTVENPAPYAGMPGTGVFLVTDAPVSITSMQTGQSTPENPFVFLQAGATPEGAPDTVFVQASGLGTIGLATYSANPGTAFAGGSNFFDVFVAPGGAFDNLDIVTCALGGATEVFWFSDEGWRPASHQMYFPGDEFTPPCIQVTVSPEGTSPTIADLMGTYFAPGADTVPPVLTVPAGMSAVATSPGGANVTFTATAIDDTAVTIVCTPPSGSLFPIGDTAVSCTATDAVGLTATATFTVTVTPQPASDLDGRMVGDGFVTDGKAKHHFNFRVAERMDRERGHVEYRVTKPAKGKHERSDFESTAITAVTFSDDPAFKPGRARRAPTVDSVIVTGQGKLNGRSGYTFALQATDQGEPGRGRDTFAIVVKNAGGTVVATISGELDGGNIQSSRLAGTQGKK